MTTATHPAYKKVLEVRAHIGERAEPQPSQDEQPQQSAPMITSATASRYAW